jgi:hypothetical protein
MLAEMGWLIKWHSKTRRSTALLIYDLHEAAVTRRKAKHLRMTLNSGSSNP